MREIPRIAIVDDDAALRFALGNLVRSAGYQASLFGDVASFLESPSGLESQLILSDYHMPNATGADLIVALRSQGRAVPVIVMSARPWREFARVGAEAGAFACLQKPFNDHQLLKSIEAALVAPGRGPGGVAAPA